MERSALHNVLTKIFASRLILL